MTNLEWKKALPDADSATSIALLKEWLHDCIQNHSSCRSAESAVAAAGWSFKSFPEPIRLIHIIPNDTAHPKFDWSQLTIPKSQSMLPSVIVGGTPGSSRRLDKVTCHT